MNYIITYPVSFDFTDDKKCKEQSVEASIEWPIIENVANKIGIYSVDPEDNTGYGPNEKEALKALENKYRTLFSIYSIIHDGININ